MQSNYVHSSLRRGRGTRLLVAVLGGLALCAAQTSAGEIRWRSGTAVTDSKSSAEVAVTVAAMSAQREGARHLVVQFDGPLGSAEREALAQGGVQLLHYVGDNAWFAAVSSTVDPAALAEVTALRAAMPVQRDWKLHPSLVAGEIHPWAIVGPAEKIAQDGKAAGQDQSGAASRGALDQPGLGDPQVAVYVLFHPDVLLDPDGLKLVYRHGASVRSRLVSINGLVIELPASQILALAEEDAVQYIEPPLPKLEGINDDNRARTGANIVQAAPYNLTGTGVTALVYDAGTVYSAHQDFGGRAHVRDTSGEHYHSTHVAGTVGGSGAQSGGQYRGMAPGVIIESYGFEQEGGLHEGFLYTDPGDIEVDYSQAINTYGADIANNSIGTNTAPNGFPCDWEGNYGVTDVLVDTIVRGDGSNPLFSSPFRIVWANGNERSSGRCGTTYHTTAPPACGKNHITVGALNSNDDSVTYFTSWGPADDGRMKPDISAPGCQSNGDSGVTSCNTGGGYQALCGTSMASPTVCGLGALIIEDYRVQFPDLPEMRNSTLKALLAHNATDIENPGPDYKTGYGSVRIQPTIDFMRTGNFLENTINQGQTYAVIVIVDPGAAFMKATLAWDDVPGTPNVNPVLVNDLDLRVYDPNNVQQYPWTLDPNNPSVNAVRTQADHINNIEQVYVASPTPGAWRVEIVGFNVAQGPQPFSLTASPQLVNCSDQGMITLDRSKYACEALATVQVVDCQLNTDDNLVESIIVTVRSTHESAGEQVILTETAPESAAFRGPLPLSETDAAGVLWIGNGDTITAEYIDADDGQGGTNVLVTDTATVDCAPPQITNVSVTNIQPRSATVTFTTNEPAYGKVRYGTSCGALTTEVSGSGLNTAHSIILSSLTDQTTYFFEVEAEDTAGNMVVDNHGGACFSFATPDIPNFFTQQFNGDNDLDNISLIFTPNGSNDFYSACAEPITALPTDPTGGTTFSLTDDSFATVNIGGGQTVKIYGQSFGTIYPSSNGYVTFTAGDSNYTESYNNHFSLARIAALYDDLNPSAGGTVSWRQLSDRVAVTWLNVAEYGTSNSNTFQIVMYFDGRLEINYLAVAVSDGLAGLSAGNGLDPDFYATDLSALGACGPRPPTATNRTASTAVGVPVTVTLQATDDDLPDPPAALTYVITSLPGNGDLSDPQAGPIGSVPYTLANGGNQAAYQPDAGYSGQDTFQYIANDGGTPPDGGDSNTALVTVTMGGAAWDPVAHNVAFTTAPSQAVSVVLNGTDPNNDPLTYVIETLPAVGFLADPNGGDITSAPYTLLAGGRVVEYQPPCGEVISAAFSYTVHDATAGSNVASATITVNSSGPRLVYSFPLDSNPGWTTQGAWAFGQPTGGGSHDRDPSAGFTGNTVYGYNLAGDYANNLAPKYLTTTSINCASVTDAQLRFRRWLGVEDARFDHATLEASADGVNWTMVWQNPAGLGAAISESAWSLQTYDVSAVADGQATLYLRWGMGSTDTSGSYPGWNIDDVEIWGIVPMLPADFNGDGLINLTDLAALANCLTGPGGGIDPGCRCKDMDDDGDVDLEDFAGFQGAFDSF